MVRSVVVIDDISGVVAVGDDCIDAVALELLHRTLVAASSS